MASFKLLCFGVAIVATMQDAFASEDEGPVEKFEKDFMSEDALRQMFEPDAFSFEFMDGEPEAEGPGGNLRPSIIATNPFLGTLPGDGNAQNLVTLEPCGVNQPHHHPRGTETSFITKGTLRFGLVEENGEGSRVITEDLKEGTSISIAQGLMHFAQNMGCERAQFLANFPHRDPGVQTTLSNFVRLPFETVRGTIGWPDDRIQELIDQVETQGNPSVDPECLKRCGLDRGDRRDDSDRRGEGEGEGKSRKVSRRERKGDHK